MRNDGGLSTKFWYCIAVTTNSWEIIKNTTLKLGFGIETKNTYA